MVFFKSSRLTHKTAPHTIFVSTKQELYMFSSLMKLVIPLMLLFSTQAMAAGKSVNIRVNPLGLLAGVANVGVDFALTNHFTLGAQASYLKLSTGNTEATANSFGVRGQLFINDAFTDSWYFALSGDMLNADAENDVTNETASVTGTSYGVLAGYMWMWTNFNIMLGFGIQSINIEEDTSAPTVDISGLNTTYPALEFNLGWAF